MIQIKNILCDLVDYAYRDNPKLEQYKHFYIEVSNENRNSFHGDYNERLEELYESTEYGGIETTGLDEIIWLFNQFDVKDYSNKNFGNSVFISNKDEFIANISSYACYKKSNNVYDSWLMMLHNLNETMDELFRYGAKYTDENVIFLKNILVFLSYISIYEDEKSWRDLLL